ncbi:MAG: DUF2752 domain-containing protein [Propionicimonas sp.]|nr:DUF2752 domain-containing protein [Propionicimonas sp.]
MVVASGPAGFTARGALRSAAWFAAAGVALSAAKLFTGFRLPCPWRAVTGTLCPLCGSTTLGTHLLRGDVAAAWASNPFVFVLLTLGVLASLAWVVEAAGGPALRPPRAVRSPRLWWTVLGVAALGFMLWRNLP